MTFNVVLKPDPESGHTVLFPDLPFGVTQGETVAECLDAAQDAITLVLDELIKRREPIPVQRRRRGRHIHAVTLSVLTNAKIELYQALRTARITRSELGRRLNLHRQQIDRFFDLKHASRIDQIEAAFHALGKQVKLEVHDLAA